MNKLNELYKVSKKIKIDDQTKIVIMSDCHRGNGSNSDDFRKNELIYEAALKHYYYNDYTYIELGDGDDMWEVKNYKDIIKEHTSTFLLLKKFHDKNRLIMLYGNHDKCKCNKNILKKTFYYYYNPITRREEELLNNMEAYESIILDYKGNDIFLTHGHQVDFLNNELWKLSRFLVRYVWKNLEKVGLKDPTSAAKNYRVKMKIEKKLRKWSEENKKILIAGHTHRPSFPKASESLYFNDGSCVHPNGITCIEIENGNIILAKWTYKLKGDYVSVGREVIANIEKIENYFTLTL